MVSASMKGGELFQLSWKGFLKPTQANQVHFEVAFCFLTLWEFLVELWPPGPQKMEPTFQLQEKTHFLPPVP